MTGDLGTENKLDASVALKSSNQPPKKFLSNFTQTRLPGLTLAAIFMLGGICTAALVNSPEPGTIFWPLISGLLAVLIKKSADKGSAPLIWLCIFSFLVGSGLFLIKKHETPPKNHIAVNLVCGAEHLLARVVKAPEASLRGHRVLVEALSYQGKKVTGLVRLSLPQKIDPPLVGQMISARLKLWPITSFANPGCFDYQAHMAEKGVLVRGYVGKRSGFKPLGQPQCSEPLLRMESLRQKTGRLFDQLPENEAREIMRALVLGQKGGISSKTKLAFSRTGTAHMLAISGLHMGMVWGFFFLVFRLLLPLVPGLALRVPAPKPAALAALLPCIFYTFLAGASTPTLRSLLMAACLMASLFLNRPYTPKTALALAAILIMTFWPSAPLSTSFQLSFTAVALIVLAADRFLPAQRPHSLWQWFITAFKSWLFLSCLVGIGLMPLIMHTFHLVSFLFLPANFFVYPLLGLTTLPLALSGAWLGLLAPKAGLFLLELGLGPSQLALDWIHGLSELPGATWCMAGPVASAVLLFYVALFSFLISKTRFGFCIGGVTLLAACVLWFFLPITNSNPGKIKAWVLDVGQGSSTVIRLPQGQVLVVDSGGWPGSDFDFGRNVVGPFLWSKGLNRIHTLICSHRHFDHYQGLFFLAKWFNPKQIWTNGAPANHDAYGDLLRYAREKGIKVCKAGSLARRQNLGKAQVRILWPPAGPLPKGLDQNNRSICLGLGLGNCWLWLPGDIGPKVEKIITSLMPKNHKHILVAPHHGAKDSCTESLLKEIKPKAVIFSAGCGNRFGMPNPKAIARVKKRQIKIFTTIANGAVSLETNGIKWRISSHLKQARPCP
jgi:competence protein ComEC